MNARLFKIINIFKRLLYSSFIFYQSIIKSEILNTPRYYISKFLQALDFKNKNILVNKGLKASTILNLIHIFSLEGVKSMDRYV